MAAGGWLTARRGGGAARRIPIEDFTRGAYETALEPGELLVSVHVPPLPAGTALVHRKMSFHERPAITVAANVTVRDGAIAEARLAVGSIGLAAQRLARAEQCLVGKDASDPRTAQLGPCLAAAGHEAQPVEDANGSAEYKRHLVQVMVERCVREALAQAPAP
jgi:carbon-monoxide dehydrogenase medium subunit